MIEGRFCRASHYPDRIRPAVPWLRAQQERLRLASTFILVAPVSVARGVREARATAYRPWKEFQLALDTFYTA